MNKNHTNESNYTKLVMPRQLVLPLDYGILIKETAPVRLLDAVLEELDYKELQHLYSPKRRKSKVPPHILFKIFVYAMSNGVYSTRMIQQQLYVASSRLFSPESYDFSTIFCTLYTRYLNESVFTDDGSY